MKRDKNETDQKLIAAVSSIMREKGHSGLGVNKVALEAGVRKAAIYDNFGGLNNLVKAYIRQKDYWIPYFDGLELPEMSTKELVGFYRSVLREQFEFFYKEKEMQKLILWQISQYDPLIRATSEKREKEGLALIALAEGPFRQAGINLKALIAILIGGSYNVILHASAGNGTMCGMDANQEKDRETLLRTIDQIMVWAWQQVENQQK